MSSNRILGQLAAAILFLTSSAWAQSMKEPVSWLHPESVID
jgi:hypothetical protein